MELISSNSDLTQWMAWAQQKAASFVMTGQSGPVNRGDGGKWYGPSGRFSNRSRVIRRPNRQWAQPKDYLPSYWAGYHDRTAFYSGILSIRRPELSIWGIMKRIIR